MAKVAALSLLAVGVVVFAAGLFVWYGRNLDERAAKEARVACGYMNAAATEKDKTEFFIDFMLDEAAKHAAKAERLNSTEYAGFGDGMAGIAARAGGDMRPRDVLAVNEVCGPL